MFVVGGYKRVVCGESACGIGLNYHSFDGSSRSSNSSSNGGIKIVIEVVA
jgi:hypothetical protein